MSLREQISEDLKSAMKEKNAPKLSVLRVLKSEIQRNEQTANGKIDLSDGDVIKLVKKLIEGIKETTKNQDELAAVEVYLPSQLSDVAAINMIQKLRIDENYTSMGQFMKYFKEHFDGQYDGKVLSGLIKNALV